MEINYENWTIVRKLGTGSFGSVYEIERKDFGVYKAALKVISIPQYTDEINEIRSSGMSDNSISDYYYSMVEDFISEFALMNKLKGTTNIVSYEDHKIIPHEGEIGWDIYIRMELLKPLDQFQNDHPFSEADVARLGIDICHALERCENLNIIHRDIKPGNIFVSEQGDFKLGDFGVARTLDSAGSNLSRKGTYNYMAPEVYNGMDYGPTVDIYSLGLVMYRILNHNRTPFLPFYPDQIKFQDQEIALLKRINGSQIPYPGNKPSSLGDIILKACAFDPADRFQTAEEFCRALTQWQTNYESGAGSAADVGSNTSADKAIAFGKSSAGNAVIGSADNPAGSADANGATVAVGSAGAFGVPGAVGAADPAMDTDAATGINRGSALDINGDSASDTAAGTAGVADADGITSSSGIANTGSMTTSQGFAGVTDAAGAAPVTGSGAGSSTGSSTGASAGLPAGLSAGASNGSFADLPAGLSAGASNGSSADLAAGLFAGASNGSSSDLAAGLFAGASNGSSADLPAEETASAKEKNKKKPVIIICIAAAVVIAVVLVLILGKGSGEGITSAMQPKDEPSSEEQMSGDPAIDETTVEEVTSEETSEEETSEEETSEEETSTEEQTTAAVISVPEFYNKTVKKFKKSLATGDVSVLVSDELVYDKNVAPGRIASAVLILTTFGDEVHEVRRELKKGDELEPGSTIMLILCGVRIPDDILGMNIENARAEMSGLSINTISYYNDFVPGGGVISVTDASGAELHPGQILKKGTEITLSVSDGPQPTENYEPETSWYEPETFWHEPETSLPAPPDEG